MGKLVIYKSFLLLFSIFFLIYSILGIIFNKVDFVFLFLSLLYFLLSIFFFRFFFKKDIKIKGQQNFINTITQISIYKNQIITLYFFLYLLLFIYPNFRLENLIHPTLNFEGYFQERFSDGNIISTLIDRLRQFVYPLFLIVLSKKKFKNAVLILLLNLYMGFAYNGYIGRGTLVIAFITIMFATYQYNRRMAKRILFISLLLSPFIFWAFLQYARIRLGASLINISFLDSFEQIILSETSTSYYGEIAYKNNSTIFIYEYLRWLFTLPVPGQLLPFEPFHLNYEIAKDIHGILPGQKGFSVTLIGLFFESIYAFGNKLFLFHALIIQFIISFILKIASRINGSVFLVGAILAQSTYVLNRGGTAGFFPFAINTLLLIIFLYFISLFVQKTFIITKNRNS